MANKHKPESGNLATMNELIEALHRRFDRLEILTSGQTRELTPYAIDAVGQNNNLEKCKPETSDYTPILDDTQCYRVSLISIDADAKIEINWTKNDGTKHTETPLIKPGTHTPCFGPVRSVTLHAQGGDAVFTRVTCTCP